MRNGVRSSYETVGCMKLYRRQTCRSTAATSTDERDYKLRGLTSAVLMVATISSRRNADSTPYIHSIKISVTFSPDTMWQWQKVNHLKHKA